MIGMPRMTLTITTATITSGRTPDTRISAHTMPSAIETTSEPSVTRIVLRTPSSKMGMNSIDSVRKRCIFTSPGKRGEGVERPSLQSPLREYLFEGTVGLELGERGVDLLEQLAVALAHA